MVHPSTEGLAHQTLKGMAWLFGARLWSLLLSLTITAVLARLLQPTDYGLLGMTVVFTGFLALLSDFGMGAAIVQKQDLSFEELSSIFWFNLVIGIALVALVLAISPWVARFYSEPKLVLIMDALSVNFLFTSLAVVPSALFQKSFRFDLITKVNAVTSLIGGCAGIAAAFLGWGVWALVTQSLGTSLFWLAAIWIMSGWRPGTLFSWTAIRSFWSFSLNLLGFQAVNYFARNTDYLLIGRLLGPNALGVYTLAYNLMMYPIHNLTLVIQQGIFPALARLQGDSDRLAAAYIKSCHYQGFITIPLMVGLALTAPEVVLTLYGPRWTEATSVVQVLSWVATFQPFISLAGTVVIARGLAGWYFKWTLIVTPIMILSFAIGLQWGIVGVAVCYLIAQIAVGLIGMPILFRKVNIPVTQVLRALAVPAGAAAGMALAVLLARQALLGSGGLSAQIQLIGSVSVGIAAYVGMLLALRGFFWSNLKTDWHGVFKKAVPMAA
jgi:O-antigen/teichoic acid export membrane protein